MENAPKRKIVIKGISKKVIFSSEVYLASLWSIPNFTSDYYDELKKIHLIHQPEIIIQGKVCHQRRDVGFYSRESSVYKYSGSVAKAFSLDDYPLLEEIMNKVNKSLKTNFNGILINKYSG